MKIKKESTGNIVYVHYIYVYVITILCDFILRNIPVVGFAFSTYKDMD